MFVFRLCLILCPRPRHKPQGAASISSPLIRDKVDILRKGPHRTPNRTPDRTPNRTPSRTPSRTPNDVRKAWGNPIWKNTQGLNVCVWIFDPFDPPRLKDHFALKKRRKPASLVTFSPTFEKMVEEQFPGLQLDGFQSDVN